MISVSPFFPRVKSYGPESDHSPQPNAEIAICEYIILRPYTFTWTTQGLLAIYLLGRQLRNYKIHYTKWYEILIFTFAKKTSRLSLGSTQLYRREKSDPDLKLANYLHLVTTTKMYGVLIPASFYAFTACIGTDLPLTSHVSFNYNRWPYKLWKVLATFLRIRGNAIE
jgi:hypothetical protein